MSKDKSGSWFGRHKVLTVILALVGFGIIASAAGSSSNTETVSNSNSDKTATQASTTAEPKAEKITIKNSVYSEVSGLKQVVGEATNNDTRVHSATIKATFYDAGGKILGTATGAVNEIAPGDTKTFTLVTLDSVAGYKDMKVQVDTLL